MVRRFALVLPMLLLPLSLRPAVPQNLAKAVPQVQSADLGASRDAAIWPGFSFTQTALLVFDPDNRKALLFHVDPLPPDFPPVDPSQSAVGLGSLPEGQSPREGTAPAAGRLCAWISAARLSAEGGGAAVEVLYAGAFKVFEAFRGFPQAPVVSEGDFPFLDAEQNALARAEGALLFHGLSAAPAEIRAYLSAFLELRRQRQSRLPKALRTYEWGREVEDGLAAYAGYLARARSDAEGARSALLEALGERDFLETGPKGQRLAATGCALALILDRLGMDWKAAFEKTSRTSLEPVLAQAAAGTQAADLAFLDLPRLLREEGEAVAAAKAVRQAKIKAIREASGLVVEVDVEKVLASPGIRWSNRYAPNGVLRLEKNGEIRERYYNLVGDGLLDLASSRPLLIETRKSLTVGFAADEIPYIALDGKPLVLTAGETREGNVEVRGNHFVLKVTRARLRYVPKVLTLEVLVP